MVIYDLMVRETHQEKEAREKAELHAVFLERLRPLMAEHGLTNAEWLARHVGATKQAGYLWMKKSLPSALYLTRIARGLDCSVDYLLGVVPDRHAGHDGTKVATGDAVAPLLDALDGAGTPPRRARTERRRRSRRAGD